MKLWRGQKVRSILRWALRFPFLLVVSLFVIFLLLQPQPIPLQRIVSIVDFPDLLSLNLTQDNPNLINYIKSNLIDPPASPSEPYKLTLPQIADPSEGQIRYLIKEIFPGKKKGTFLEVGAFDGETHSTTIYMERFHNWTGLLVEASPNLQKILKGRNRKVPLLKACLSTQPHPQTVKFLDLSSMLGRIAGSSKKMEREVWYYCNGHQLNIFNKTDVNPEYLIKNKCRKKNVTEAIINCVPLYSALLAAELTKLDFLSIDTEGSELAILKTLPLDKVDVKLIRIEVFVLLPDERVELRNILEDAGYERIHKIGNFDASDVKFEYFYVKKLCLLSRIVNSIKRKFIFFDEGL